MLLSNKHTLATDTAMSWCVSWVALTIHVHVVKGGYREFFNSTPSPSSLIYVN